MTDDLFEPGPFVEPLDLPLSAFPESTLICEGMKVIVADPTPRHGAALLGVTYARKSDRDLHLQILLPPMEVPDGPMFTPPVGRFPLIVFVQGSAWMEQMLGQSLPSLAHFSQRGYVIAIVEYRPSVVAPFPAQVRDTVTAVRYLRRHADEYHIDIDRIVLWGDSSGGHTTVLTYLTEGNQEYSDEPVGDEQLGISCYVDYYAPTHIARMNEVPSIQNHIEPDSPEGLLIGRHNVLERPDLVAPTVAMNHVRADRPLKPLLMIHGSKDRLVPFAQSVLLYEALVDAGQPVEFFKLQGADHAGPAFWQEPVLDIVDGFIRAHLPVGGEPSQA
jgi:acetyl esterase/lipase